MASYNWSTKIQAYLAKIAGKEVENLPEPTTKEQQLLKEIAENGGSGGGFRVITIEEDEAGNPVADITYEEASSLINSGTPVFVDDRYLGGQFPTPVIRATFDGTTSPETFTFQYLATFELIGGDIHKRGLVISPTGEIQVFDPNE